MAARTSAFGAVRPQVTTSAPAAKKARTIPAPTPRDPPVTTTALPVKSKVAVPWFGTADTLRVGSVVLHRGPARVGWSVGPLTAARLPFSVHLTRRQVQARPPSDRSPNPEREAVGPMPITTHQASTGIAEVVIDHPPVNALDVAGWFDLADALLAAGRVAENRVVILRAEGRGFCAGVDIKEIQAKGDEALVGVNRGCAAAFAAVYDCEVPVIAAVQGFCLGGGIGLTGNADIVVASEDATFGLPEVDRGALGAATHLARLVPQHKMRQMVYTAKAISASELAEYGSVAAVVPKESLRDAALAIAEEIAAKSPSIIRRAKESLNGIDPVDVKRSYRYEQGFTYELHVRGVADEQRDAFVEKRDSRHLTLSVPTSPLSPPHQGWH